MTAEEVRREAEVRRVEGKHRRRDWFERVLGLVAAAALVSLVLVVWAAQDGERHAVQESQTLAQKVSAACSAGGDAERELERIGACKRADALQDDAQAPPEPLGPTNDQVRSAVNEWLRDNPPADGRTPTAAEVTAVVEQLCGPMSCRGADGKNGADGSNGADGTSPPPQSPTDDQVRAAVDSWFAEHVDAIPLAVAAYCDAPGERCKGIQGAQGPPGPTLPQYRVTEPGILPDTTVTMLCTLRLAESLPHYDCVAEGS
jgi:hypothetical protein